MHTAYALRISPPRQRQDGRQVTAWATAEHEARHVVSGWAVGGYRVESLRVDAHAAEEGIVETTRLSEDGVADLVTRVIGWMNDPSLPTTAAWPEPFPPRPNAPDGVGWATEKFALSQAQYEAGCKIAEELLEDPDFQEAVELVARAAMVAPQIDHEGLEMLRKQTAFADEPEVVLA